MDSPANSVTSPISLRGGSTGGAANVKVARLGPECGPEINKWLKLKSLDEDDGAATAELQRKLKAETLNGLRELLKEVDDTAWMYAK